MNSTFKFKCWCWSAAALAIVAAASSQNLASAAVIGNGSIIKFTTLNGAEDAGGNDAINYDYTYGNGSGGGEFQIWAKTGSGTWEKVFKTFCIEIVEHISLNHEYEVTIGTAAILGGAGGGNPDPLSNQAAYLFEQYSLDQLDTATGFFKYNQDGWANALQNVFWKLENEITTSFSSGSKEGQLLSWLAAQSITGNIDSTSSVQVMNVWEPGHPLDTSLDSNGKPKYARQSQMVYFPPDNAPPLPEPASLATWAGLSLLGLIAGRRRMAKARANHS